MSCFLRHCLNRDDALIALPAGLVASAAFTQYPDNTVALYVMWKAIQVSWFVFYLNELTLIRLQILCGIGQERGVLPRIPNFMLYLYAFFTAVLFHAGIVEAQSLRPNYYKFLQAISGERCVRSADAYVK